MTVNEDKELISEAAVAVQACADEFDERAKGLLEQLPQLPMEEGLRAAAMQLCAGLKDTAGRVMFELSLLKAQLDERKADAGSAVRRLSRMDGAMMDALAPVADIVDKLEADAERDEQNERAFVLVIEASGTMLQRLDEAKTATQALRAALQ
ncbi:MAG TPA: hypothetical protein VLM41_09740 [Steroidobacteraceae bacterium]|nr:hypothetical protein [Steroidobacteraceae bacterium]